MEVCFRHGKFLCNNKWFLWQKLFPSKITFVGVVIRDFQGKVSVRNVSIISDNRITTMWSPDPPPSSPYLTLRYLGTAPALCLAAVTLEAAEVRPVNSFLTTWGGGAASWGARGVTFMFSAMKSLGSPGTSSLLESRLAAVSSPRVGAHRARSSWERCGGRGRLGVGLGSRGYGQVSLD